VKTRHRLFACLAAALALVGWQASSKRRAELPLVSGCLPVGPVGARTPVAVPSPAPASLVASAWPRAEAAKYLTHYFAKELLGVELELEQARYHGQYWEAEPGLAELRQIETRRTEAIARLTAEMNGMLEEMCPGAAGAPLALVPYFSLDHPAPNLAFLSEASRGKMEEILLAREEPADAMAAAAKILSGPELADYARWNAPSAAALRNRLAGFDATEGEFNAVLEWQHAAGSEGESEARNELVRKLGAERVAQLDALTDPAVHTATQDLHRLGLPLDQAGWLTDFRRAAVAQLQRSWRDPRLTDAQKQAEVGVLRDAFRDELTTQLKIMPDAADLLP
jgi:hypothetical protein